LLEKKKRVTELLVLEIVITWHGLYPAIICFLLYLHTLFWTSIACKRSHLESAARRDLNRACKSATVSFFWKKKVFPLFLNIRFFIFMK
jgi:hypothetical protein